MVSDSEDNDGWDGPTVSRRKFMAATGTVVGSVSAAAGALSDSSDNYISGGDMAIDEVHRVKGTNIWYGPAAGMDNVEPKVERKYETTDWNVDYYGDGTQWVPKKVGSQEKQVPEVHSKSASTDELNSTIKFVDSSMSRSEIESVINNASPGTVIYFQRGEYHGLQGAITVTNQHNLTIKGPGKHNPRKSGVSGAHLKLAGSTQANVLHFDTCSNITVEGLTVDGNGGNQTDADNSETQVGIYGVDCTDMTVRENYVYDTVYANIRFQHDNVDGKNHLITENTCDLSRGGANTADDGISLTGNPAVCEDWKITENTVLNCAHQSIEISTNCSHGLVANNNCVAGADHGIVVHFGEDVHVEGNFIKNCKAGFQVNSSRSTVEGNYVDGGTHGAIINGADCKAKNNTFVGSTKTDEASLRLAADNVEAIGNSVHNGAYVGIGIRGNRITVRNNVAAGCSSTGIETTVASGNAVSPTIEGNTCRGNSGDGIKVTDSDAQINDNQLYNNGVDGILINGANAQIQDNKARNNGAYGFRQHGSASETLFDGNTGSGNSNGLWDINGTRGVWNGQATNAGDPSAGSGEWAGNSTLAYDWGIHIVDTSTEGDLYYPLPPGATNNWSRVSGTAV